MKNIRGLARPASQLGASLALLACLLATPVKAEPVGFVVDRYAKGIANGVDIAWLPGTKRMFVSEEDTGRIRIVDGGKVRRKPCIDLDVSTTLDHGLVGLALHPNFKENKFLYAYYTTAKKPR